MSREVIEVDQWSSTGDLKEFQFDSLNPDAPPLLKGGDSEAIQRLGIARFEKKIVEDNATPSIAHAWFVKGADGRCEFWKACYDSS